MFLSLIIQGAILSPLFKSLGLNPTNNVDSMLDQSGKASENVSIKDKEDEEIDVNFLKRLFVKFHLQVLKPFLTLKDTDKKMKDIDKRSGNEVM